MTPSWCFPPLPVVPFVPWWFDPVVATGFEYDVVGNTFDTIELPTFGWGDNLYDIDWGTGSATGVAGGAFYDLPTGISALTVTGIDIGDTGAGEFVDPTDPLAFITGFTFETAGVATLTMTPITFDTDPPVSDPIPEPSTWVLLGTGLIGLGLREWRKKTALKG